MSLLKHPAIRAALATIALTGAAHAATIAPPQVDDATPTPVAAPYPDTSLAQVQVKEAFRTASKTHRKVMIVMGGNWCPDCRILAGIMQLPKANAWVNSQFVVVPVNVGRMNTNLDIAAHYGVAIKAVPAVLIVTPEGKLLDPDGSVALGNARAMTPQSVLDLIGQWNQRG